MRKKGFFAAALGAVVLFTALQYSSADNASQSVASSLLNEAASQNDTSSTATHTHTPTSKSDLVEAASPLPVTPEASNEAEIAQQPQEEVPPALSDESVPVEAFFAGTTVITPDTVKQLPASNQKPSVNVAIQQSIQNEINKWDLTESSPIQYSVDITGLFEDPDGDLLTTRVFIDNDSLKVSNLGSAIAIQGEPEASTDTVTLIAMAKDNYHGLDEEAWTKVSFVLPTVHDELEEDEPHPLIGHTWYRLETTNQIGGRHYNYEVIFCEAFKFINDQVFYASSENRILCPDAKELRLIGAYHQNKEALVVTSNQSAFDAEMAWRILSHYPADPQKGSRLLATVQSGSHNEVYTLHTNKDLAEAKINGITGQYAYQIDKHDYLYFLEEGVYVQGVAGMYFDDSRLHNPTWEPQVSGDLNMQSANMNVTCQYLLSQFDTYTVAGQGAYGDIIGTTSEFDGGPLKCLEMHHKDWGTTFSYLDVAFSKFYEFSDGEVFSIIFRPKKDYAHLVEELKLNLRYYHSEQYPPGT